ncbi:MAG TPA: hypothetical protein VKY90_09590 [Candidatus Dormibacteraeota bacterium]|nr:hypothetical protein [Candidatus Dormibacteraeota bacterium]
MRSHLGLGGLIVTLGVILLVVGVREQLAWDGCAERCTQPSSWPVTVGTLLLLGGGAYLLWTLASTLASRALRARHDHPSHPGVGGSGEILPQPSPEDAGASLSPGRDGPGPGEGGEGT